MTAVGGGRRARQPLKVLRKNPRTRARRSSISAPSASAEVPKTARQRRQVPRRDHVLGTIEQQTQPQRHAAQRAVILAQGRRPAELDQPVQRARRGGRAHLAVGGVAELAERDQELDVHDPPVVEAEMARAGGHAAALGLHTRPHLRQVGPETRLVEGTIVRDGGQALGLTRHLRFVVGAVNEARTQESHPLPPRRLRLVVPLERRPGGDQQPLFARRA